MSTPRVHIRAFKMGIIQTGCGREGWEGMWKGMWEGGDGGEEPIIHLQNTTETPRLN